ncbi:hypothetical protein D8B46_01885 [Candidatus Gracilibacteria bacterium]|nr:MAG: hypothetical protein D8B46_01885 [Candidatus Gracilibacteria bacterium]
MFWKTNYGLALGGGSARGFVHIGVIKYLEEKNIKITEISGTSMGAIVGAFLAFGKNSSEMLEIAKELKILKLVDLDFKFGFVKGNKVVKKLRTYFGDTKIEDLKIKLKIVATDLGTGERKVFESGDLVDAIRASISLPGVFKPYKIGDNFFIDGGVVCNLPIDELTVRNKIGVSAINAPVGPLNSKKKFLWFEVNKSFFNLNYQILYRAVVGMMIQNEKISIEKATGNKQILNFDFGELGFTNFSEAEKFTEIGYEEAKKSLKI